MAPDNRALAELTVKQLENWDPGYSPFNGLNSGREFQDHMEPIASQGGKARWKKTLNEMMRGRLK
jgi:hypothetical protein